MAIITTFPRLAEFEKMKRLLHDQQVSYEVISPEPAYNYVGQPAIVIDEMDRSACEIDSECSPSFSGWIEYLPSRYSVPSCLPHSYEKDIFGTIAIMVTQPCLAEQTRIRAIAHLSGNLADVFPYMNTIHTRAFYNLDGPSFTFMDEYRMISLYPGRIAIAKADDIVDLWRILESLRISFNQCWLDRKKITPSYELRKRPAALEIYFHLPKTNCSQCGEKTCMAFALKLWSGQASLFGCKPIFSGDFSDLRKGLFEVCAGLDVFKE